MLVGWSLRSKVIGQEDHGLNLGATGSIAYTSRSACFLSHGSRISCSPSALVGETPSVRCCSAAWAPLRHRCLAPWFFFWLLTCLAALTPNNPCWCDWLAFRRCRESGASGRVFGPNWAGRGYSF